MWLGWAWLVPLPSPLSADDRGPAASAAEDPHAGHTHPPPAERKRYTRLEVPYAPPDVPLVDQNGAGVTLGEVLDHPGPVLLQFIFTTCPAVCPALAGTFSAAQHRLGEELPGVRMISISIDPEHDTPRRLRDYAERFSARSQWRFLTGGIDEIVAVQKAFDAYQGNKMRHQPLSFVRGAAGEPWVRLDGFLSATELVAEYRRARSP